MVQHGDDIIAGPVPCHNMACHAQPSFDSFANIVIIFNQ
jgi:hypothetical protein